MEQRGKYDLDAKNYPNPYSFEDVLSSLKGKEEELKDKPMRKIVASVPAHHVLPTTVRSLRLFAEQEKNKAIQFTKETIPGHVEPQFILELTKDINRLGEKRVSEYITRNKTILLCDYALQIKQQDIYRMKDLVNSYEQMLDKDDKKLEQDAINFNEFIKSMNENTAAAVECSFNKMKHRSEKQRAVKEHETNAFVLKSNIAHLERLLSEYLLCAQFLDASTSSNKGIPIVDEQIEDNVESNEIPQITQFTGDVVSCNENLDPITVPFSDASELLKAISRFRDQNLTIITNSHYLRNALKVAEEKFKTTYDEMEKDIEQYNTKIEGLKKEITDYKMAAKKLEKLTNQFKSNIVVEKQHFEELLTPCVASTYELCTGIKGGQISLTMMVAAIESSVLSLLFDIEKLSDKLLSKVHKAKQNERKIQKKKEEEKQRAITQEERTKITDMRRFDSAKTKLSRRLHYKPQMTKGVKKVDTLKTTPEDTEEDYHFFFG